MNLWPKSILPKGLYGRVALILVVPLVTIQLILTVVFIQRHFDGVTRQMTLNVAIDLNYFLKQVEEAPDQTEVLGVIRKMSGPLGFSAQVQSLENMPRDFLVGYWDLAGKMVINVLRGNIPGTAAIDLVSDHKNVLIYIKTSNQPLFIAFDRSRVNATNPQRLFILMIMISIGMALITYLFLRDQIRPIEELADAAEAFGKGQRTPYAAGGANEIKFAGQAFLDMRERLERQIEQRTRMLSGVSHDLRTPLTRLKLGLSLIGDDGETRDLARDVDDMEEMLEEFLSFARGDSLEETKLIDPQLLVNQIVADARRTGGTVDLDITNKPDRPAQISIRPNAVRRGLENLLTNALRYGEQSHVTVDFQPGEIRFVVEDNGPGIPEGKRELATRPFERLDEARNQNRGTGVGLGLAIAMDVASSHGGSLDLSDSKTLGGLKVTLRLPL